MERVNEWLVLRFAMRKYMHALRCTRERGVQCRCTWVYGSSVWHENLNCVYISKHTLFLSEQLVLLFSHSNVSSIYIVSLGGIY